MKTTPIYQRITFAVAIATSVFLGACSSTPVTPTTPTKVEAPAVKPAEAVMAAPAATMSSKVVTAPLAPYLDPKNALSQQRSAYFDFDKYDIKPEARSVIELHGKYLSANPGLKVRIEGNTDEAGGEEYNLALGQRRAQAVVTALKVYGVKDAQMESISFGKTKPKASGHDAASNAQNRRADIAYPAN
jgi:peptidoglycan-associated lipoprotein